MQNGLKLLADVCEAANKEQKKLGVQSRLVYYPGYYAGCTDWQRTQISSKFPVDTVFRPDTLVSVPLNLVTLGDDTEWVFVIQLAATLTFDLCNQLLAKCDMKEYPGTGFAQYAIRATDLRQFIKCVCPWLCKLKEALD